MRNDTSTYCYIRPNRNFRNLVNGDEYSNGFVYVISFIVSISNILSGYETLFRSKGKTATENFQRMCVHIEWAKQPQN